MSKQIYLNPLVSFLIILLFGAGAVWLIVQAIGSVNWMAVPANEALL